MLKTRLRSKRGGLKGLSPVGVEPCKIDSAYEDTLPQKRQQSFSSMLITIVSHEKFYINHHKS